jgi:BioD-like phosphotransacetylase family protein
MSIILVASSEARVGRSLLAAAVAYRIGRAGKQVMLARLGGDESAAADAAAFAALAGIVSPGAPVAAGDVASLAGDVVLEAPAGGVRELAAAFGARVLAIATTGAAPVDAPEGAVAGSVLTRVPASGVADAASRAGVLAVWAEDRVLAAPSVTDIAAALDAEWLGGSGGRYAVDRVMIGTVASDAAEPYFGERQRTCVITRFDKTDIQLAALLTDLRCLVITGGGEPSPYLLDRVTQEDVAVLRTKGSTPESVRAIEGLYTLSRFEGEGKLQRAVELLDQANFPTEF